MAGDWIKIHRSLIEDTVWQKSTPEQKVVLLAILMIVNHKEKEWEWKGQKFKCEPGQKITSLASITEACGKGITIQKVRTALVRFEKLGFLTNESTKTGRLITVVNWGKYQGKTANDNKATNNDLTMSQQRPNNDLTSNKNDKNVQNEKNIYMCVPATLEKEFLSFAEMRKSKNKPLAEEAAKLILEELLQLSNENMAVAKAILNKSTKLCWSGVYPLTAEEMKSYIPKKAAPVLPEEPLPDINKDDLEKAKQRVEIMRKEIARKVTKNEVRN